MTKQRLVVAVTGATGVIYAVALLRKLRALNSVEVHLVMSSSAVLTLHHEMSMQKSELYALADVVHSVNDVGATISSGSFQTAGMIVVPCSMRTLAAIAHGLSDNLITRAADVHLKERRPLVLAVRETPFNLVHIRNMEAVTEMGGIIYPPLPAFYHEPKSIQEMVDQSVDRMLSYFHLPNLDAQEWQGLKG